MNYYNRSVGIIVSAIQSVAVNSLIEKEEDQGVCKIEINIKNQVSGQETVIDGKCYFDVETHTKATDSEPSLTEFSKDGYFEGLIGIYDRLSNELYSDNQIIHIKI